MMAIRRAPRLSRCSTADCDASASAASTRSTIGWSMLSPRQTVGTPAATAASTASRLPSTEVMTSASAPRVSDVGDVGPLALDRAVGVADPGAVLGAERVGEAAGQLAVERVGDVGDDDADHLRAADAQAAGHPARPVAQLLHRRLDALAGRRGDRALARQHVGDGRRAHAGDPGDVGDGGARRGRARRRGRPRSSWAPLRSVCNARDTVPRNRLTDQQVGPMMSRHPSPRRRSRAARGRAERAGRGRPLRRRRVDVRRHGRPARRAGRPGRLRGLHRRGQRRDRPDA